MGVITGYTTNILCNNQYAVRYWSVDNAEPINDAFTATNVWRYENPENSPDNLSAPRTLVQDQTKDLLPIGTLVQLWEFKIGESCDVPILKRFFNLEPHLNPSNLWSHVDGTSFGDTYTRRYETDEGGTGTDDAVEDVCDYRILERDQWGITGFEDPLYVAPDNDPLNPNLIIINNRYQATIDENIPGLIVYEADPGTDPGTERERPIFLWHRSSHKNMRAKFKIGMPTDSRFPPYDILLRAPIDRYDDVYARVVDAGTISTGCCAGYGYTIVEGIHWKDLPKDGALRILNGDDRDRIWKYTQKVMYRTDTPTTAIMLLNSTGDTFPTEVGTEPDLTPTIVELLHYDYNAPCVRIEFSVTNTTDVQSVQLQFKVGTLNMAKPYELDESTDPSDDFVRGLSAYAVSRIYTQDGFCEDDSCAATSTPTDFRCYVGDKTTAGEFFNEVEILYRDSQLWIWWNGLLIPPDTTLSAQLPEPVGVATPYFPLESNEEIGKFGMRLWPTAVVRSVDLYSQISHFSEFTYGQLEITT
jgi:hypothetical protein